MAPPMRTVSFKLPGYLVDALSELAARRRCSRAALAREALELLTAANHRSVTASAGDLVGSLDGPSDLATNARHLARFGK
ncbi:MAG: ribbon-helix-helix protein, CopG family [Gemmatimonadaceae bacterium]